MRTDEASFTDGEQPVYEPPRQGEVPNLEADLARDQAFIADLAQDRFARAVYTTVQEHTFRKAGSLCRWGIGSRRAAAMVAGLRGLRESYMDYYPHGDLEGVYPDEREAHIAYANKLAGITMAMAKFAESELNTALSSPDPVERRRELEEMGEVSRRLRSPDGEARERAYRNADVYDRVKTHLDRLGWRVIGQVEREEDRLRALRAIKRIEAREAGAVPDWAADLRAPGEASFSAVPTPTEPITDEQRELLYGHSLELRLLDAALAGKLPKDEYDEIRDWL